jgi:hypothetical protein
MYEAELADAPAPFALDAITVNVYGVPSVRPDTVQERPVVGDPETGVAVQLSPPADAVTL